ncbi:helix-turn-helix domain-containing protein [Burkholderia sp. ABCPW 11]|uniref:helix-turn-helix domain-containing protein n=1 Tax=Burkholderia sp. ABCPW 11 TaxID=1637859 RepID=UPI000A8EE438|nr:helix-turn-helix domain-containing protein [Burkholderia sp. ABCPW 11]
MADPMEELRATAARLKRESDDLVRKVDALPRHRESSGGSLSAEQILQIARRAVQLFEQQPPRPVHVTQAQAADMLGITARTVHTLVRTGKLKLNGVGRIPIGQIDLFLARTKNK